MLIRSAPYLFPAGANTYSSLLVRAPAQAPEKIMKIVRDIRHTVLRPKTSLNLAEMMRKPTKVEKLLGSPGI
jgi:hypothetical protein